MPSHREGPPRAYGRLSFEPDRGKTRCPESQGGRWKRGLWWNCEPTSLTERAGLETLHLRVRAPVLYPTHYALVRMHDGGLQDVMMMAVDAVCDSGQAVLATDQFGAEVA